MNRHLLLLITAMLFSITTSFAQGGTTGPLTWNLSGGTLTISGNGAMPDYWYSDYGVTAPWLDYQDFIHTVVIEIGVANIGNMAFFACTNMTSVIIPNSVVNIGASVFTFCTGLISITIPNSVISIGESAFYDCENLTSIIIPNSVTSINNGAFQGCKSLTSITIPNSVTNIGRTAFRDCISLSSISLPNSLTSIDEFAFYNCYNLTSITNLNSVPIGINSNVFQYVNQNYCILNVPMASVSAYQNAEVWKEFNIVGINVGIETIEATTVNIYPNPTTGKFKIENGELSIEKVVIYDISGKIQKIENWKTENGIDISQLPAGVYFVKIFTELGEVTKKVLKE